MRSQINGNLSRLLVSDDGKTLWADLRYWPSFDETPPPRGRLRTPHSVFFGDRPLNNPGYHEFQLGGSVGGDPASDNRLLDVARVEQRLNRASLRPRATSPKAQHCQKEFSRCSPWISHP